MERNFELEKLRFEREQLRLALDQATSDLDLNETQKIIKALALEPSDLKELQSKTSQLPHLHRSNPEKLKAARLLAEYVNDLVVDSRHDKTEEQIDFLTKNLIHEEPLPKSSKRQ